MVFVVLCRESSKQQAYWESHKMMTTMMVQMESPWQLQDLCRESSWQQDYQRNHKMMTMVAGSSTFHAQEEQSRSKEQKIFFQPSQRQKMVSNPKLCTLHQKELWKIFPMICGGLKMDSQIKYMVFQVLRFEVVRRMKYQRSEPIWT